MIRKFGALFLLLILAACVGDSDPDQPKPPPKEDKAAQEEAAKAKRANLICPQVAIIEKTQESFDYGGEQPDPSQLVAKARMKNIEGDCAYQRGGIDISFTLHMVAARGPRLGSGQANFPYFIGIVDPAQNIITRQTVTAHFSFAGNDKIANTDEPLHVFIPLSESALQGGPDYRVLVGFRMAVAR